LQTSTKPA
jgi:hypothetical protein